MSVRTHDADSLVNYDTLEKGLLSYAGSVKEFPFGPEAAVFKVAGKMFALVAVGESPLRITLKCNPGEAVLFRATYAAVKPGYYMNKDHWNTITLDGSLADAVLASMIGSSYLLVVKGLRKAEREALETSNKRSN